MTSLLLALLLQVNGLNIIIPGGLALGAGTYSFGPFDMSAETKDVALTCDMALHLNPLSTVNWKLFVSYDGTDPLGETGQSGGGGNMRGGNLLLDGLGLSTWRLVVGLDTRKPHNQVKLKMQMQVVGLIAVTVGDCAIKSSPIEGGLGQ